MDIDIFIKLFNWLFNHLLVFINLGTFILTIILSIRNQYQPFIEAKHQQILNDILFPFYESIELHLFEPITKENKTVRLQQLNHFIQEMRSHQLFYLLGSSLTSHLLIIENDYIKCSNSDLKTLNNHYYAFSNDYFKLSWAVRKNLKIETNEYHYKKRLYHLTTAEHAFYRLHPKQLFPIVGIILFFSFYLCFIFWVMTSYSVEQKMKAMFLIIAGSAMIFIIYVASLLIFPFLKWVYHYFKKWIKGITRPN
ncbi:hypothetical protein MP619_04540 [Streptococcus dysgalactiae]|uniref:Uncharacterized protein n=2 Tax=Streptococcus dysgalactiae group TaxID=119603 RepID=A0AAX2LI19_STRSZ|nr:MULTISPECIES: hypothetical protein [Streptococcus dysgalactiae group]HER9225390.1 hypothetical protein [Streptococcus pyogenes]MCD3397154.1 hypothetical protein [Streptococcus equi subsp. zooepidemicus]MCD3427187.1 hypothetical protein [Streptococcus equi subsp. zooepidemicus]MCD3436114.1 hypothetical protein [Streptococcus equi subsp. zooepidemicus]MCD3438037.1 hypothetical protein [Streptococcus equi subsp. zooepidemicus]